MLPEHAYKMLEEYKINLGRCEYLKAYIEQMRLEIADWRSTLSADLIEGSSQSNDGQPHGTTVGNPTERIGLMLASGFAPDDLRQMEKELTSLQREYGEKFITVSFVESWLRGLTEKERWIIEQQIFEGMTYRELNQRYRQTFGDECSKDKLRGLRKTALDKVYSMAA